MRFAVVLASRGSRRRHHAQTVTKDYAAPLTDGLSIPGTSISTEFDARAATFNPGRARAVARHRGRVRARRARPRLRDERRTWVRRVRRDSRRRRQLAARRASAWGSSGCGRRARTCRRIRASRSGSRCRARSASASRQGSASPGITSTPTACSKASTRSISGSRCGCTTMSASARR